MILVDDSIVRGTTSTKIVEMLRQAGAREIHMRISSPPTMHSCFYGIATPERDELLASHTSVHEMAQLHRRRQPGLRFHRRALPRHGQAQARQRRAAILRRLLHRRLSDPAGGSRRRQGFDPAFAARRDAPDVAQRVDGRHRARHRRLARHRRRRGPALGRRRRACHPDGAHPGRARGSGRRDPPGRRQGDAGADGFARFRQDRPDGRGAPAALQAARRAGGVRGRAGSAVAGGPCRPQAVARGGGGESHGQLPADPGARSPAAAVGERPRRFHDLRPGPRVHPLLGRLCREQGRRSKPWSRSTPPR